MDPISIGISAVGLGMQIFGGFSQAAKAKEAAGVNQDIARQEMAINAAKSRQMELEAKRTQMQNIRNAQRARAMATQAATTQGAQFGTGLQGGLAQIQAQMGFNMLGVDQALATGREINKYNDAISQDKMKLSSIGAESATAAGWSSLGGALLKAGPVIGQISQGFGNSNSGDYTGMPWSKNTGNLY